MRKFTRKKYEAYLNEVGETLNKEEFIMGGKMRRGQNFYRYGYGSTDNWTTVCEGLTERPNLKKMKLIK